MHPPLPLPLPRLRRVRWVVRLTLVLGVAASVAANVLHARPDPVAQIIAAWPPLALLLTIELISRVPVHRRVLATARLVATTGIAGIAGYVSYVHMSAVAAHYGEIGVTPYLLPLSVDGLVIVASVSLVELAGRIRTTDTGSNARPVAVADLGTTQTPTAVPAPAVADLGAPRKGADQQADATPATAAPDTADTAEPAGAPTDAAAAGPAPSDGRVGNPQPDDDVDTSAVPPPPDEPPTDPKDAVAYWHTKDPTLRPGDLAAKIGRSRSTVRRILTELDDADRSTGNHVNGGRPASVNGSASTLADTYLAS